eukprot:7004770-Prymnesium_polylepis.1
MHIRSTTASREGCRGRECDYGFAEVGRLQMRFDVRIQSAGIAQGNVGRTSADRRHRKRPSRHMFRAGDDDGAVRRLSR